MQTFRPATLLKRDSNTDVFLKMSQRGQSHLGTSREVVMTSQVGQFHLGPSCNVFGMSQVGQFHLGTSCNVFATSQVCQSYVGNSWYIAITSQISQFYLGTSGTSWQRPKQVRLINVPVATSWWCLMWSATSQPKWDQNETSLRRRLPGG